MFEITLRIMYCGVIRRSAMDDWIQDARRREEKARQDALVEEKARQNKTEAIGNALPAWWAAFKSALEGNAEELKKAFPKEPFRHFSFFDPENEPMMCSLISESAPERRLDIRVEKSFPHYTLIVEQLARQSGKTSDQLFQQGQPITGHFQITNQGELTLSYIDSMCPSAPFAAEKVIRRFVGM